MPRPTCPGRRLTAVLGTAATIGAAAVAVPQAVHAAPAAPAAAAAAASNCPSPYPLRQVHRGLTATGWTTSKGQHPQPFHVKVIGVLKDGISPGIDLIVIRANSPAIKHAGGIWAGMSGSPIYTSDGRLLGALSYSFSFGPAHTAGVTPAGAMYKLFGIHGHTSATAAGHVRFDSRMQQQLVTSGAATPAQAAQGMRPITTPISVSGVPASHFAKLRKKVRKLVAGPFTLESGAAVGSTAQAKPASIQAGGPFVASLSTGDITFAGIGTATAVCHGRVLAFGHPLIDAGTVRCRPTREGCSTSSARASVARS